MLFHSEITSLKRISTFFKLTVLTKSLIWFLFSVCPKTKITNRKRVCFCETPCSPSTYGRVTYTYPDQNLRFYPGIARDTEHFKKVYKRRTIIERTNHLFKNVMGIGKTLQRNGDSFKSDLFLCGITQLILLILADKLNNLSAFRSIPKLSKTA